MQEILHGTGMVVLYYIIAASTAFACRMLIRIPDEIFRKALHFILLGSYPVFLFAFKTWWRSAVLVIVLEILISYSGLFRAVQKLHQCDHRAQKRGV